MGNGKIRKRNKKRNNMEKSIINCKEESDRTAKYIVKEIESQNE